jgi:hypothetical protein
MPESRILEESLSDTIAEKMKGIRAHFLHPVAGR